ncbi:MAG: hypothetical protein OXC40_03755 [Proteobacteria bacterium]|nr:hypothetical protein [Pseudomonadota bacterium]
MARSFISQIVCLLVTTLLLTGCLSLGKDFTTNVDWLKVGKTSQQQVIERLGMPEEIGQSHNKTMWTYYYIRVSLWQKIARKELRIFWHNNQLVHSYNLTSSPTGSDESLLQPSSARQKSAGPSQ